MPWPAWNQLNRNEVYKTYRNDPKFSDRQAWANSADPDQTAPLYCLHCSSNFRVITTNVLGVRIFRKFTVVAVIPLLWVVKFGRCSNLFQNLLHRCLMWQVNQVRSGSHTSPLFQCLVDCHPEVWKQNSDVLINYSMSATIKKRSVLRTTNRQN